MEWPVPINVDEDRSFVSTCSYYRRYVAGFATIAAPLHQLTKHGEPFVWNAERQQAFDTLKSALSSAPILAMPKSDIEGLLATIRFDRYSQWCIYRQFRQDRALPDSLQLLVPKSLRREVMTLAHADAAGSQEDGRSTPTACLLYGWKRAVDIFCRNCSIYRAYHIEKHSKRGPLQPFALSSNERAVVC